MAAVGQIDKEAGKSGRAGGVLDGEEPRQIRLFDDAYRDLGAIQPGLELQAVLGENGGEYGRRRFVPHHRDPGVLQRGRIGTRTDVRPVAAPRLGRGRCDEQTGAHQLGQNRFDQLGAELSRERGTLVPPVESMQ